jgi:hypothetical protein
MSDEKEIKDKEVIDLRELEKLEPTSQIGTGTVWPRKEGSQKL